MVEGQPVGYHYWAIDDGEFVEEFQLRTEFPEKVMQEIGSIGYAVGVFEQGKGYGKAVLRLGLELAKQHGMRGATFAETALDNPMITKLPYKT